MSVNDEVKKLLEIDEQIAALDAQKDVILKEATARYGGEAVLGAYVDTMEVDDEG